MTKISTLALATLISISALSTAEATYTQKFVEEADRIAPRTLRSGKVRAPVVTVAQTNLGEDEQPVSTGGSISFAEEAEDAQSTGILHTMINYISSFFARS